MRYEINYLEEECPICEPSRTVWLVPYPAVVLFFLRAPQEQSKGWLGSTHLSLEYKSTYSLVCDNRLRYSMWEYASIPRTLVTLLSVHLCTESQTDWGRKGSLEVIFSTSPCSGRVTYSELLRTFSLIRSDNDSQEPTASSHVVSKKGATGNRLHRSPSLAAPHFSFPLSWGADRTPCHT